MPIITDELVPLDNKQLRFYDKNGDYIRLSVDEVIARKLNYWNNWYCSAGERSLYIDYDGRVWIANCASSKYYEKEWKKYSHEYVGQYPHKKWYRRKVDGERVIDPTESKEVYLKKFKEFIEPLEKEFFKTKTTGKFDDVNQEEYFGYCGNIYDRIELPEYWVQCPFEFCGCGADVILSKSKDDSYLKHLAVSKTGYEGQFHTRDNFVKEIGDPVALEMNFPINYQILWDIGRRCNYDCDYCWPGLHNNIDPHHNYEIIKKIILYIIKNWSKGKEIRWNFGGGEPTLHPNFLDIVRLLKEHNQWILVTTNGSRDIKYWKELRKYCNTVNFSAHFGSMAKNKGHEKRFIENVNNVLEWHNTNDDDFWIEIKLMTPPGMLEYAVEFKNKIDINNLTSSGKNGRMKGCCSLVPIRDDNGLVSYSKEELVFFENQ